MTTNRRFPFAQLAILVLILVSAHLQAQTKAAATKTVTQINLEADDVLLKAFDNGDVNILNAIIAPEFINHAGGNNVGVDSLKKMVNGFHSRMGTVKVEVKMRLSDEKFVADWIRFTGTATTNATEGIELTRYENGKAVEHWFFGGGGGVPRRPTN